MRHDWLPRHQAITVDTPTGTFVEMEVQLSEREIVGLTGGRLRPSPRLIFEPWLRVRLGSVYEPDGRRRLVPEEIDGGIEVIDQDDGA